MTSKTARFISILSRGLFQCWKRTNATLFPNRMAGGPHTSGETSKFLKTGAHLLCIWFANQTLVNVDGVCKQYVKSQQRVCRKAKFVDLQSKHNGMFMHGVDRFFQYDLCPQTIRMYFDRVDHCNNCSLSCDRPMYTSNQLN